MNTLDDTLYYAMQGLESRLSMQHNCCFGWSGRHIVRTGIEVAQLMLADEEVEAHKEQYFSLISKHLYGDVQETMMTVIVMTVLFGLIDDRQATRCRATLKDDWCDEIEDVYHSYCHALDEQIDLEISNSPTQTFSITVMKTDKPQITINVAGNYIAEQNIDIHDNPNATIYLGAEGEKQNAHTPAPPAEDTPAHPQASFPLLTETCLQEGKAQTVEAELRSAAKGSAQKLMQCIRTNEALGYLDTKNMSSQALYDALNAYFGLPFKYRQFVAERNK